MSSESEINVQEIIAANSTQLNACDLLAGPVTVRVLGVKGRPSADGKQPIDVKIDGGFKPWRPCLTMRRLLVHVWGAPPAWVGRSVTLYNDPSVSYGSERTGGIRISHMSHLPEPTTTVRLMVKRAMNGGGVYADFTVRAIAIDDGVDQLRAALNAGVKAGWTPAAIGDLLRAHGSTDGKAATLPADKRATVIDIVKRPPASNSNEPPPGVGVPVDAFGEGGGR